MQRLTASRRGAQHKHFSGGGNQDFVVIGKTLDEDAPVLRRGGRDTLSEVFPVWDALEMSVAHKEPLRAQWSIAISVVISDYG